MGDMVEGALYEERKAKAKKNKYLVMGPLGGTASRRTGRQTVGRNITLT
jgi:hypothetical protein